MTRPALRATEAGTLVAVAVGGALGALARWTLGELLPEAAGFPWTTFGINLSGSFALALLPAIGAVRSSPLLAASLGPGVLGGFTTLSAYAEQARALVSDDRLVLAATYVGGTLAACLIGVAAATKLCSAADQRQFRLAGGEE